TTSGRKKPLSIFPFQIRFLFLEQQPLEGEISRKREREEEDQTPLSFAFPEPNWKVD
ncbi:hypothetical protein SK128_005982, partial [Halocaridina rubra]